MKVKFLIFCAVWAAFFSFASPPLWALDNAEENPWEADMVSIPAGMFLFGTDKLDTQGEALAV
ncbi:MAG: hypothetical protein VYC17_03225, partial [Nitrospinota bacterium]|nr:hypothetical protein [Nitrospinota bacterium]